MSMIHACILVCWQTCTRHVACMSQCVIIDGVPALTHVLVVLHPMLVHRPPVHQRGRSYAEQECFCVCWIKHLLMIHACTCGVLQDAS